MKKQKYLTSSQIIDHLIEQSGCENGNQFAAYLTEKYGVNISRQQINQFQNSDRVTITHLLLREALEQP